MSEVLSQERPVEQRSAVEDLVAYLRQQPYQTDYSARELAREFNLDSRFVSDVLDTLRGSPNRLSSTESIKRAFVTTSQSIGGFLRAFTDDFVNRPYLSLPLTLVMAVALMITLRWLGMLGLLGAEEQSTRSALESGQSIIVIIAGLLHGICIFRNGLMRIVMYSALWVFFALVGTLIYLQKTNAESVNLDALAILFVGGLIACGYIAVFGAISLLGGFRKSNQVDLRESQMSRQELLDRLFQLQEKVREFDHGAKRSRWRGLVPIMRRTPWLPVIGLSSGILVGVVGVFLRGSFVEVGSTVAASYDKIPLIPRSLDAFIVATAFVSLGYLSGGLRRSLAALTLFFGGKLLAEAIPFSLFGPEYIHFLLTTGKILNGLEWTVFLSLVLGIGSHIDARARVRQKLQDNDPAYMLAEMIEIHWRLNPSETAICVLAVDVAGSTTMKQDSDPLHVEYSFRAFQDMVAGIANRRNGNVLSQAGDGAVLTFQSCPEAMYAAKEIQTEISRFNATSNRLDSAFRVRVGLHTGQTSANLVDVPFNELIDIAAHVERESPVGGIAVTESVIAHLGDEKVAAMKDRIDGQAVFIVMNPTLAL